MKILRIVLLVAALIGGYFAALLPMMLWLRIKAPLYLETVMEIPHYGYSRWITMGSIALIWAILERRTQETQRVGFGTWCLQWLIGSAVTVQMCTVAVFAVTSYFWDDPDVRLFYDNFTEVFWARILAIPVNVLTTPFGKTLTVNASGRFSIETYTYDVNEVSSIREATCLHWMLCLATWLAAGWLIWKLSAWISRKMQMNRVLTQAEERTVRLGWSMLMFFPIYVGTLDFLYVLNVDYAAENLLYIGERIGMYALVLAVLTPLFYLFVRSVLFGSAPKRSLLTGAICAALIYLVLFGVGSWRTYADQQACEIDWQSDTFRYDTHVAASVYDNACGIPSRTERNLVIHPIETGFRPSDIVCVVHGTPDVLAQWRGVRSLLVTLSCPKKDVITQRTQWHGFQIRYQFQKGK